MHFLPRHSRPQVLLFGTVSVAIMLSFWYLMSHGLDPDFGWHLQMGKLIAEHGIPKTDPFSYTMPSFHFIDHEWLSDLLLYKLYTIGSYTLLTILFALCAGSAVVIATASHRPLHSLAAALAVWVILLPYIGVRLQVVTWLMFAIFVRIICTDSLWKKYRYFLPLVIVLWVNLHAGFALGIGLICLKAFIDLVTPYTKLARLDTVLIAGLSILASFINPYTIHIWLEIWRTIGDAYQNHIIIEWLPLYANPSVVNTAFLAIMLFFYVRLRKVTGHLPKIALILLFLASIHSTRHLPLLALASGILLLQSELPAGEPDAKLFPISQIVGLIALASIGAWTLHGKFIEARNWREDQSYPKLAIDYLGAHPSGGQIFNEYDWGGYLIWQYPEKKVFIDGRMPAWRNYRHVAGESDWVLHDFMDILDGTLKFDGVADKYNIDTVLIRASRTTDSPRALVDQLEQSHWSRVYSDQAAVVFRKI